MAEPRWSPSIKYDWGKVIFLTEWDIQDLDVASSLLNLPLFFDVQLIQFELSE